MEEALESRMMLDPGEEGGRGKSGATWHLPEPSSTRGPVTLPTAQALGSHYTFYGSGHASTQGSVAGSKPHRWRATESGDKPAPHFHYASGEKP